MCLASFLNINYCYHHFADDLLNLHLNNKHGFHRANLLPSFLLSPQGAKTFPKKIQQIEVPRSHMTWLWAVVSLGEKWWQATRCCSRTAGRLRDIKHWVCVIQLVPSVETVALLSLTHKVVPPTSSYTLRCRKRRAWIDLKPEILWVLLLLVDTKVSIPSPSGYSCHEDMLPPCGIWQTWFWGIQVFQPRISMPSQSWDNSLGFIIVFSTYNIQMTLIASLCCPT